MARLDLKDSYHMLFWEEARDQIVVIEQELLQIEAGTFNEETVNRIFRMAHSIKGGSSTLNIKDLTALTHVIESLISLVKKRQVSLDSEVMNLLLEGIDLVKVIHENLVRSDEESHDISGIIDKIEAFINQSKERNESGILTAIESAEDASTLSAVKQIEPLIIQVYFDKEAEMLGLKAYIVINALAEHGDVLSVSPIDYETIEDDLFGDFLEVELNTDAPQSLIEKTLAGITELNKIILLPKEKPKEKESTQRKQDEHGSNFEKTTVKVNIQKIDQLINLVGELIIDKESLHAITKTLKSSYKKDKNINRLLDVFNHLDYIGSELQEIVLSTRLLPLDTIFCKFPRMVRDLAITCHKNIHFVVEGKEHSIDRGMIESLMDPLTHLIRNAVDHGFEDEWTRVKMGKPVAGTLKLSASQGDNHVIIVVMDDGQGMDVGSIQKKAIQKGFISIEESEYLSADDWMNYIFMPGFTTTTEVSDISGRGVGLDVVKSNISKLNGQIEVETTPGKGTKFTIKLPLTLAIIKAMLIKEDDCTFAIPVSAIVEVIRLTNTEISERIHNTGYSEILHWREFTIPLHHLNQIFELNKLPQVSDKLFIIVLGIGEKRTAIVVEEILGEQEIVIKSMADFVGKDKIFGELRGISGVSILGSGGLAHILDVADLMKL